MSISEVYFYDGGESEKKSYQIDTSKSLNDRLSLSHPMVCLNESRLS